MEKSVQVCGGGVVVEGVRRVYRQDRQPVPGPRTYFLTLLPPIFIQKRSIRLSEASLEVPSAAGKEVAHVLGFASS